MRSFMMGFAMLTCLFRMRTDNTVRGIVYPSKELTHLQDRYSYPPRLRRPSGERNGRSKSCIPGDYDESDPTAPPSTILILVVLSCESNSLGASFEIDSDLMST
jgi:hypothetical protein